MKSLNDKLETLRIISHPVRVKILKELAKGVRCVGEFEEFLGISQPNISQHLSLLRQTGVIDYFTDGRLRCYFLKDSMIPHILEVLERDYEDELPSPPCCPITKRGKYEGKKSTSVPGRLKT